MKELRRYVLPVIIILTTALGMGACGDYKNLTGIGNGSDTTGVKAKAGSDTTPPSALVLAPRGALEVGDTVQIKVSDNSKLAKAALLVLAGTDTVVFSSDTVPLSPLKDSATTLSFIVRSPGDSVPNAYGRVLRAVGYVADAAGNASYSGQVGVTNADLRASTGVPVTLSEGKTINSPVSVDDVVPYPNSTWFYYVSGSSNTLRMFVSDSDKVAPWSLAVGSRPSKITIDPRGPSGTPVIVTANAGGRELSYSSPGSPMTPGTLGGRVASPDLSVFVDSSSLPSRIPGNGVAAVTALCRPGENCRTLVSVLGTGGQTFIHSVGLVGDPVNNFEFVAPNRPGTDIFGDTVSRRIQVQELVGGVYTSIFTNTTASTCGTLFNTTPQVAARPDGIGALYAAGSMGSNCGLLRLLESGGKYSLDVKAAYNASGDPRLSSITGLWVDKSGDNVLIETPTDVLVADSTLHVTGAASGSGLNQTPLGAGFLEGDVGSLVDGDWVVVASPGALTVYRTSDFRPLAVFKIRASVAGRAWIIPTGVGDGLIIGGVTSTRDGFVSIHTSVGAINARSLKFTRLTTVRQRLK